MSSTDADREIAASLTAAEPDLPWWLAAQHLVQREALRYAIDVLGLRQVLDLGCGHWTSPGSGYSWIREWEITHPGQRLRYIGLDADPIVIGATIRDVQSRPWHCAVRGDLAKIGEICDRQLLAGALDLTRPTLVLATGVLQHLDQPGQILAEVRTRVRTGSVLAVSHPALPAPVNEKLLAALEVYRFAVAPWWPRPASTAREILAAWTLPPDAVMPIGRWHPPTMAVGENGLVEPKIAHAPGWAALATTTRSPR